MTQLFKSQAHPLPPHPSACNALFPRVTIPFRKIETISLSCVFNALMALFFWFKSLCMEFLFAANLVISLTSLYFTYANYFVEYKICTFFL